MYFPGTPLPVLIQSVYTVIEFTLPVGCSYNTSTQILGGHANKRDGITPGRDVYIDGLVQERRNSSALAIELRLSCTNLSTWCHDTPHGLFCQMLGGCTNKGDRITPGRDFYRVYINGLVLERRNSTALAMELRLFVPPEQRSCWGVYWLHSVRQSVRPSVCPSVRLSVRPSVRPSVPHAVSAL